MIQNNNTSVLPWYTSIEQQNHRKSYAYGQIYPLFAPANRLLPFQIIRGTRENNVTSIIMYDKTGQQIADITSNMIDTGLQVVRFQPLGYDVILYPGNLLMALDDNYETCLLTRWAKLLARGAEKYSERNWEQANSLEEFKRFKSSAYRHFIQAMMGEDDEDHFAAVLFNLKGMIYQMNKLKINFMGNFIKENKNEKK